jgi:hypothetical protein
MKELDSDLENKIERLEAKILESITHISRVAGLINPLQDELMRGRASLRNLITAYKSHRTDAEIDDLVFAIIRDDALTREDIQIVFDLNDILFLQAIKRMNERDYHGS